ncbi:MAG: YraN family protein [Flavobacteriaceae bacterium]|jgi:putative endonuclease|nr:YraN family protein [Flavobacteriaceae bacterium]
MASHNDFGNKAEELAADFLVKNNYKILAKNFRFQKAEIDIIAEKDDLIIIIEVKARSSDAFALPQEAVNKKKIRLIVSAANYFLEESGSEKEIRFDIITVLPDKAGNMEINHIENAFQSIDSV